MIAGCSSAPVVSQESDFRIQTEVSEITRGSFRTAICENEVLIYLEKLDQGDRTLYLDSYGHWRQYMGACADVENAISERL